MTRRASLILRLRPSSERTAVSVEDTIKREYEQWMTVADEEEPEDRQDAELGTDTEDSGETLRD